MSLPAVILVGGQGTRLLPLTERTRKDMLPLVDRPLLAYTFEHLRRHGVRRGIVSCGYLPTQIREHFGNAYGELALDYEVEDAPLGTGGAIGFAARDLGETFFALNGDSLREADLDALLAFHRSTGARATILLTPVSDPSRYGLVRLAADGRVSSFLEKPRPEEIDTNLINAGLYVLEPSVLELIPRRVAPSRSSARCSRSSARRDRSTGSRCRGTGSTSAMPAAYLQAQHDVLERRFRTEVGDAARARLHARRPVGPRSIPAPGSFPPCTSARARRSERAPSSAASQSSAPAPSSAPAASWSLRRRRSGRSSEARSTVSGSILGEGAELGEAAGRSGCPSSARARGFRPEHAQPRTAPRGRRRTPGGGGELPVMPYAFTPRHIDKPWGYELIWAEAEDYVGKVLFVRAGQALSLQYHEQKDESWLVQDGRASLELGDVGGELTTVEIAAGDAFRYRPGTVHRVTAIEDTTILEVSTPHLDDVVRIDDRYGRPERDV